jgi:hypothetical protein
MQTALGFVSNQCFHQTFLLLPFEQENPTATSKYYEAARRTPRQQWRAEMIAESVPLRGRPREVAHRAASAMGKEQSSAALRSLCTVRLL